MLISLKNARYYRILFKENFYHEFVLSIKTIHFTHTPLMYALICAVGALISMVGDLAASAIKRNKEIKDYGTLIPGHGGILDRFDSVIFTAPFIYFLSIILL